LDKIISFGGGVNSIAMTIMLYKRGEIYPCVFADTMAEHPETYCYMDYFEKEFMSKYGQKIIRLDPINTPQYYYPSSRSLPLYERHIKYKSVPMAIQVFCSNEYKRHPLEKFAPCEHIIGFAFDERHRAKDKIYPLIDVKITRQGCIDIIRNEGLNVPRKSGCFFCSMQRISQWEDLWKNYPDLFQRAIDLENNSSLLIRSDGRSLEVLRERFESKGAELFPDYDYEELTPCMCIT